MIHKVFPLNSFLSSKKKWGLPEFFPYSGSRMELADCVKVKAPGQIWVVS